MRKSKYKKVVELPTGVTTKIADTLEGKISVYFLVSEPFDKPLKSEENE